MPVDEINSKLNPTFEDERANGIEDYFIKAIYKDGFKVEYVENIDSGAKGYCDFENSKIVIKKGLGNLMRLKVVIHEYAHSLAHKHLLNNNQDYIEHRNKYETEAESIAYVVTKYLGLDVSDYSNMYLYSWSKDKDFKEIDDSLNTIVDYSNRIINNYEYILNKEKNIEIQEVILLEGINNGNQILLKTKEVLNRYPALSNYGLNEAVKNGFIPVIKIGKLNYFDKKDIEKYLSSNKIIVNDDDNINKKYVQED